MLVRGTMWSDLLMRSGPLADEATAPVGDYIQQPDHVQGDPHPDAEGIPALATGCASIQARHRKCENREVDQVVATSANEMSVLNGTSI
jgi:hypothetical protein